MALRGNRGQEAGLSGYDWAMLLADRGGEALESFIASLLINRYPNARQVNPSQGDGGIDVLLEAPSGLVIWQVKRFASPITSGQWSQIKRSWNRFLGEHVDKDAVITEYNLVTPWTPTAERYKDFEELTSASSFATHWRGEAWLNLLADEAPATTRRFQFGPNALEQYTTAKALIAASPVELSDSITTLDALRAREEAIDDLYDLVSDHYSIRRAVVAAPLPGLLPRLPAGKAAMHQFRQKKNGDWVIESVIPKSESAHELDPISVSAKFHPEEDSEAKQHFDDWLNWGVPFEEIAVQTRQTGGPFGSTEFVNTLLSVHPVVEPAGTAPPLTLELKDENSVTKARIHFSVEDRTEGPNTGWRRMVAVSKERTIKLELRFKTDEVTMTLTALPLTGLRPEAVRDELKPLAQIEDGDSAALLVPDGQHLIKPFAGFSLPAFFVEYGLPISESLATLQQFTPETLLVPDFEDALLSEIQSLHRIARIYAGEPLEATWSSIGMRVPEDPVQRNDIKKVLEKVQRKEGILVALIKPEISLGSMSFTIPHPLTEVRENPTFDSGLEIDKLQPGQEFNLLPDGVGKTTTSVLRDWTQESGL